jgi:hypothetical protein
VLLAVHKLQHVAAVAAFHLKTKSTHTRTVSAARAGSGSSGLTTVPW